MMESLLSPSESHAFQSFLSAIDYTDSADWSIFNQATNDEDITVDVPQGKEELAKATKDLMSLDPDRWDASILHGDLPHQLQQPSHQNPTQPFDPQLLQYENHRQRQTSLSHRPDIFPFLNNKQQFQQQLLSHNQQRQHTHSQLHQLHPPHLTITPQNSLSLGHGQTRLTPSSAITPTSPHPVFDFASVNGQQKSMFVATAALPQHQQVPRPHQLPSHQSRVPSPRPNGKRPSDPSTSLPNGSSKRQRPSTTPYLSHSLESQGTSSGSGSGMPLQKQTLLSPSQKKANHIQSEQKRRANIRRGYEALCDTVPALREAIKEEEEEEARIAKANGDIGPAAQSGTKKGKRSKKGKDEEKERIDGRAGPRSENVVLSKTIDYINDLISERCSLLARLHQVRSALPPGHPALFLSVSGEPLWEREWKGGDGKIDGEGDNDGESADAEKCEGYDDVGLTAVNEGAAGEEDKQVEEGGEEEEGSE